MKLTTATLAGKALDWAVAHAAEGGTSAPYSREWAFGGPIIEREGIAIKREPEGDWKAVSRTDTSYGWTPLIAAMRCYVVSKLGNEVEVPEEFVHVGCGGYAVALNEAD
jgi:hypothetical protein